MFVFVFGRRLVLFVTQFVLRVCSLSGNSVRCQPCRQRRPKEPKEQTSMPDDSHDDIPCDHLRDALLLFDVML